MPGGAASVVQHCVRDGEDLMYEPVASYYLYALGFPMREMLKTPWRARSIGIRGLHEH